MIVEWLFYIVYKSFYLSQYIIFMVNWKQPLKLSYLRPTPYYPACAGILLSSEGNVVIKYSIISFQLDFNILRLHLHWTELCLNRTDPNVTNNS